MDKDGTTFKENNLMVHGEFVSIVYKKTSILMEHLVEYTTKGENIYFPDTSETPFKKKLETPLKEELIYEETYDFKIICDMTYSIKINYNNIWIDLDKNGNVYTKTIKIDGEINDFPCELFIVYGPVEGQYISLYLYKIIENN